MIQLNGTQRRYVQRALRRHRAQLAAEQGPDAPGGELNIVPFLDVVVNLVMFLLMTVTASLAMAELPVELPELRPPGTTPRVPTTPVQAAPPLVHIGDEGVQVFEAGLRLSVGCEATPRGAEVSGVSVPRVGGAHDWLALRRCAEAVAARAGGGRVDLSAEANVAYDDIVGAMDALRGPVSAPLFGDVRWIAPGP